MRPLLSLFVLLAFSVSYAFGELAVPRDSSEIADPESNVSFSYNLEAFDVASSDYDLERAVLSDNCPNCDCEADCLVALPGHDISFDLGPLAKGKGFHAIAITEGIDPFFRPPIDHHHR